MFSPYSLEVTVGYHWREISKPAVLRPDNYILNFVTPLQTAQMLVTNGRDIYITQFPLGTAPTIGPLLLLARCHTHGVV